jgi:hypothetical protein
MKMAYVLVGAVAVAGGVALVATRGSPSSNNAASNNNPPAQNQAPGTPQEPGGDLPPGHPNIAGMDDQSGQLPPGHPSLNGTGNTMGGMPTGHPSVMGAPAASVDEAKLRAVTPARGKDAHRIAEIFAERQHLAGQKVRVRGLVVKVTPDIRGMTYLHLQDGTGNAKTHDNDLTVTTQAVPKIGDTLTFEGTLGIDVDVGIGYRYPALLENAVSVDH